MSTANTFKRYAIQSQCVALKVLDGDPLTPAEKLYVSWMLDAVGHFAFDLSVEMERMNTRGTLPIVQTGKKGGKKKC